ncbi:uncharacterized protein LOC111702823 [Eurytemora carolleeae]|uniref:uncharacterized protein LOC111702823 n=1 Tax=Eurytemora carolleeae TaxID=1294199 RepID=UPI000C790FEA|nr:uncharacterized protein LOC111702823 [Eurytemora carolleeae]|eukprot:XP_023330369.1 uncharacterized protein LOC111702823 [Eurytemora affinis]
MDLAYRTVILVCFKFSDDGGPNLIELIKQMLGDTSTLPEVPDRKKFYSGSSKVGVALAVAQTLTTILILDTVSRNPGLPRVELFGLVFLGFLSSYSSSLILDLDSAAFRVELVRFVYILILGIVLSVLPSALFKENYQIF